MQTQHTLESQEFATVARAGGWGGGGGLLARTTPILAKPDPPLEQRRRLNHLCGWQMPPSQTRRGSGASCRAPAGMPKGTTISFRIGQDDSVHTCFGRILIIMAWSTRVCTLWAPQLSAGLGTPASWCCGRWPWPSSGQWPDYAAGVRPRAAQSTLDASAWAFSDPPWKLHLLRAPQRQLPPVGGPDPGRSRMAS